ncbi:Alpha/beta hydrolase family protein [Neorhodopirellula pilleata]|uniref:Alpha/beta hydrolase family protein n=2 Tax=Neorhodopirellula pilleata TaxID=2714738 RepID=A0A5C6APY1_9BACT|nr:Alpha/beta hydrolase family protein [Neorhodopirellula pilleata]
MATTATTLGTDPGRQPKSRPSIQWRIFRTASFLVFVYLCVCAALVYWEPRLVFPGAYFDAIPLMDPNRFTPDEPIVGTVSPFEYTTTDGSALFGRIYVRDDAERVVLFLHGNGIRAIEMDGWTRRLSDVLDATVLTAEYRGFQASAFTPTQESCIEDAVSAMDALSEATGTPVEKILVYGRSLGGGIAAGLIDELVKRKTPPKSIVLDRTFDSVAEAGSDMFWFLPVKVLMHNHFDSVAHLNQYQGNVVQIHGAPDRIVPMKNGRALYESLTTPTKVWIEVPDMRHNDRISLESLRRIRSELERLETSS